MNNLLKILLIILASAALTSAFGAPQPLADHQTNAEVYEQGVLAWWNQQGQDDVKKRLEYFREVVKNLKPDDYRLTFEEMPNGIKNNVIRQLNPQLSSARSEAEQIYPFKLEQTIFTNSTVFAGVFGMTHLAISDKLLQSMTNDELRLVIYHEYSHLLFLPETVEAIKNKNFLRLKEIEIAVDLTAIYLSDGSLQIYESMLDKSGETDEQTHPPLKLRKQLLHGVSQIAKR